MGKAQNLVFLIARTTGLTWNHTAGGVMKCWCLAANRSRQMTGLFLNGRE